MTAYSSQAPKFTPGFLVGSVLLIVLVFCVVLLCVSTFWVPCCDVRYDFRIKTMYGSSSPPVVCWRAHVLFTLFVSVCLVFTSGCLLEGSCLIYVICVCMRIVLSDTYCVVLFVLFKRLATRTPPKTMIKNIG